MGLRQSKDELLYHQVNYGNVEGIKALRREGAGLEVRRTMLLVFFVVIAVFLHSIQFV